MQKEIEELRRQLEAQNEKYRSLEEENKHLRESNRKKDERMSPERMDRGEDMANSGDWNALRMPKKIESPLSSEPVKREVTRQLEITIEEKEKTGEKERAVLNSFKKQFEAYECSSPSNAMLEEQLKSLKKKNVEGMFKRKELKL